MRRSPFVGPLYVRLARRKAGIVSTMNRRRWGEVQTVLFNEISDISETVTRPVFIKVGANDGVTGDPCGPILIEQGWHGVLVEPVPYCLEKLANAYPDRERFKIEPVAVGRSQSSVPFYFVEQVAAEELEDLPDWWDQLGSFNREHILKHLSGRLQSYIGEMKVEVATLDDIVSRNDIKSVEFLHIDTEGHDFQVLLTIDLTRTSPRVIMIEKKHLKWTERRSVVSHLKRSGYRVANGGGDYVAVRKRVFQS